MKPLQLGLPLDLANEGEVKAFLAAQERIQKLTDGLGTPSEVSAFAFYTPFLMKEERRGQQLANQKKYKLPIIHMQTPVQMENSLVCDAEMQERFGKQSLLETTITHVARLREHCPGVPCSADTHVGVFVIEGGAGNSGLSSIYSPEEFSLNKTKLLETARQRFASLEKLAAGYNMPMLLETVPPVVMIPDYRGGDPVLQYLPFSGILDTKRIGNGSVTLDVAHWAGARGTQKQFQDNNVDPSLLFSVTGVNSWEEYLMAMGSFEEYLTSSRALHLSNTNGIGVKLNKYPELAKRWGDWGTDDGLLSKDELQRCVANAREHSLPVMIEVDYDIKRIAENKYAEADSFLRYVLG